MKKQFSKFTAGIILSALVGVGRADACNNVFVQTINNAGQTVDTGMNLNAAVPESRAFSLSSGGSRIDTLVVAPGSPNPMTLSATVSAGGLSQTCTASVANNNVPGECNSVIDPKYNLIVTLTPGTDAPACKHDNGNHKGEYKKLGQIVGVDVPLHSGKPNAECKGNKKGSSSTSTPAILNCSFALVSSF